MPQKHHHDFHSSLDKWNGGKYARSKTADAFTNMDPADIIIDLRKFYRYADKGRWRKYLKDFDKAVKETLESAK